MPPAQQLTLCPGLAVGGVVGGQVHPVGQGLECRSVLEDLEPDVASCSERLEE